METLPMVAWDRRRYLFVPRPCRKKSPSRAIYGFVPQVSVNGCKGTKNISYLQIKSQIFSNLFSSCRKLHIAKLCEPQNNSLNILYSLAY